MGLLDDAIREHLELKRRRGADAGEVAREQHEALDPVPREPDALAATDAPIEGAEAHEAPEAGVMAAGVPEDMPDDLADAAVVETPAAAVSGETVELDMRTVLGAEEDELDGANGGAAAAPLGEEAGAAAPGDAAGVAAGQADEDSLEWEMPAEAAHDAALEQQQPDEDVLEETPEFLRDTPEQERLWFEQRPPRDFDFDK
ncbi:MAG TPA: hypothetical protein VH081_10210 [Solirubrobacteraceae bacterium]|nr:hypothetical protein [Solirubrobacteraceae bacterium]